MDFGMSGYIKKALAKYSHDKPSRPQQAPYPVVPRKYGAVAQDPIPLDESPEATDTEKKRIQQVVGTILYYARAVDMTLLAALSSIASEQTKATKQTMTKLKHMLDYLATHQDATMRFYASDMILNIHSDASYLSEPQGKSRAAGHFFLGWTPRDGEPIRLNGSFFTLCSILKFVAASAAEAELGALFLNMREGRIFRLALEELGHHQPPTPIHCDNATTAGIVNGTIRQQRSRMFQMRYFYACDQVDKNYFNVYWHPGAENLGDYASKHHEPAHHKLVRPIYLHEDNSPRQLTRALTPQQVRAMGVGKLSSNRGKKSGPPKLPSPRAKPCTRTAVAANVLGPTKTPTDSRAPPERIQAQVRRVFGNNRRRRESCIGLRGCVGNKVGGRGCPPKWPSLAHMIPGGRPVHPN